MVYEGASSKRYLHWATSAHVRGVIGDIIIRQNSSELSSDPLGKGPAILERYATGRHSTIVVSSR